MKLRLFALRDSHTGKLIPEFFAASKPEAKRERERDRLNLTSGESRLRFVVVCGPDHRRAS